MENLPAATRLRAQLTQFKAIWLKSYKISREIKWINSILESLWSQCVGLNELQARYIRREMSKMPCFFSVCFFSMHIFLRMYDHECNSSWLVFVLLFMTSLTCQLWYMFCLKFPKSFENYVLLTQSKVFKIMSALKNQSKFECWAIRKLYFEFLFVFSVFFCTYFVACKNKLFDNFRHFC